MIPVSTPIELMRINAILVQFPDGSVNVVMVIMKRTFIVSYAVYLKNGLKYMKKTIYHCLQAFQEKNILVNFNYELIVIYTRHLLLKRCKKMKA